MTMGDRAGDALLWALSYLAAAGAAAGVVTAALAIDNMSGWSPDELVRALVVWPFVTLFIAPIALPGALAASALPEAFGVRPRLWLYTLAGAANAFLSLWIYAAVDSVTDGEPIVSPLAVWSDASLGVVAVFLG
ncbi:MAG: hypothetical protein MI723_12790, partial [Caulobacterales bacterium]|nr:hypothetical protein [Caulobacterales bacterium]